MNKLSSIEQRKCFTNSIDKKNYNQQLFTLIAPKYNWSTKILSFNQDKSWKNKLLKSLPAIKEPVCLDLACGTGDITFNLAIKYPKGKIYGLDITEKMLEIAKKNNKFPNIEFVCKDMINTNFSDNSFDIITGSYALRNSPNLKDTLIEIQRILKPQGTLAILDFSKSDNKFTQKIQYYLLLYWGYLWGIILHNNYTTYGYIAESLKHYPCKNELEKLIECNNFMIIKKYDYFFKLIQLMIIKKIK